MFLSLVKVITSRTACEGFLYYQDSPKYLCNYVLKYVNFSYFTREKKSVHKNIIFQLSVSS